MTSKGPITLEQELTRSTFESLVDDLIEMTVAPTVDAIDDAGLKPSDINNILLVGGSTRIPKVQQTVKKIIDKEPRKDISPDECVALGAAIQASILAPLDDELETSAADRVRTDGPVNCPLDSVFLGCWFV